MSQKLRITILGLSITSSWGNGHATTYRSLVKALTKREHDVTFLERNQPWYANSRDMPDPPYGKTVLYDSVSELKEFYSEEVLCADFILLGSYVTQAIEIGRWITNEAKGVTAFYDIDTPVTLAQLEKNCCEYLSRELIPGFDLYLTFTGGPIMEKLEKIYGANCVEPLYCSVDEELYYPQEKEVRWDLGYMGTYSSDRQKQIDRLLIQPAKEYPQKKMIVAGPQYPSSVEWPPNVERIDHLAPSQHPDFYNSQTYTLNVTRQAMIHAGFSPSVRLFEAAACGTPIISDYWEGLEQFFQPGLEILVACGSADVEGYLNDMDNSARKEVGTSARARVLLSHTATHRAKELEQYWLNVK